ncbi:MAG: polysaccharide lyase 8 family protein [Prolixibacteraceae bacterium]|jgi:chondroitin AC lyase|nr:polysaccharide lyase 8 family protein [Prolixibacteraceae bacterium]MBT6004697.1 polysaccharide lyase 8 family protein [Prolixibacteraceae bacterium]MBT6764002.1 polysaccharide lyase 8 family protein [Prolixibacteraceae bacterium]MBT6998350.1 polysaccharide lyase 8 family protein [Prolixibacteraceae bacterium]MBT7397103.1 polysaccharide lyase 8 family protein [Prolixibacteraceae bacterium]
MKFKTQLILFVFFILFSFNCSRTKTSEIFQTSQNYPIELQQLHWNILTGILNEPAEFEEIRQLLSEMKEDGSWPDIDYSSKQRGAWEPRDHLKNLLEIAKIYQTAETDLYRKNEVSEKIHLALDYWLTNDFICPNWWYPVIGVPMVLNPILILMEAELSEDQLEKAMPILRRCEIGRTGQNKVWQSSNVLLTSLLTKDIEMVRNASKSIHEELVVSLGEGVQPDWSYHQHGPQLQFGNYGLAYAGDMINWISILRKTPFHFDEEKVSILRNYLLKGQQWVTWKNLMDISACGRQLFIDSPETKASGLSNSIKKMETVDPDFEAEYLSASLYENLAGNKHFWRSDFQVQRTRTYYFSVKMCSERVIGAESCNSENLQGYYMGDGATFFYQTGDEYRNIFPFWDWKKIPGTTTQQDDEILPVLTASGYRIENDFVGGVSDGENGIAIMAYYRKGLKANKSWFMFNNLVVCMGAGINSQTGLPVTTSVNQNYLNGEVIYKFDTKEIVAGENQFIKNPNWILHDNTGYFLPEGGKVNLETKTVDGSWSSVAIRYPDKIEKAKLFKLWFEHGNNPTNEKYNYILVPNATKPILNEMEKNLPFKIINEKDKQEVSSSDGAINGIVFYRPGKSGILGGIEVDKPCLVMLKKKDNDLLVSIADPTQKLDEINMILNNEYSGEFAVSKNGKTKLNIKLPDGGEAGKTVILKLSDR